MNPALNSLIRSIPLITPDAFLRFAIQDPNIAIAAEHFGKEMAKGLLDTFRAGEHPVASKIRDMMAPKMSVTYDGIGVIPVKGPLMSNPDPWDMLFYGVEDTSAITSLIDSAASNPKISGILLNFDSPGGSVTGGFEAADAVKQAAATKPVVSFTAGTMASLAYLIGSQATKVVSTQSAQVGSVGVIAQWPDVTGYLEKLGVKMEVFTNKEAVFKDIGATGTSLTDAQREHVQAQVDSIFQDFAATVNQARPLVPKDAMRGQVFRGKQAKAAYMVDRIGNEAFAMSVLRDLVRQRAG